MELQQLAQNSLGLDISRTQNKYGCVESIHTLLWIYGVKMKERLSTIKIYQEFLGDNRFIEVTTPLPGDIIITPTINNIKRGHIGIVLKDGTIASNSSNTYLMENHIKSVEDWRNRYKGMTTKIFRHNIKVEPELIQCRNELAQMQKDKESRQSALDNFIRYITTKINEYGK